MTNIWKCIKRAIKRPDLLIGALVGKKCWCGKSYWKILQGEC